MEDDDIQYKRCPMCGNLFAIEQGYKELFCSKTCTTTYRRCFVCGKYYPGNQNIQEEDVNTDHSAAKSILNHDESLISITENNSPQNSSATENYHKKSDQQNNEGLYFCSKECENGYYQEYDVKGIDDYISDKEDSNRISHINFIDKINSKKEYV